jgi:hypothetical protein
MLVFRGDCPNMRKLYLNIPCSPTTVTNIEPALLVYAFPLGYESYGF